MKIQIKKIKMSPEILEMSGQILASSITISDVTGVPGANDENIVIEYDSLSPSEKIIVDNYINLIKNK